MKKKKKAVVTVHIGYDTRQHSPRLAKLVMDGINGTKQQVVVSNQFDDVDIDIEDLADLEDLKDLEDLRKEMREVMIVNRGGGLEDAEVEVIIKEMREGLAEAREATKLARIELRTLAESDEWKAALKEAEGRTFVTMKCDSSTKDVATTVEREDGATEVIICEKRVMSHALKGLEQARAAIAENEEITGKMRKEILKELDQQIKSWRKDAR